MLAIIIVVVGVLLDQFTKLWAAGNLVGETIEVLPGLINFTYAENTGAAFGIFANATWLLAIVSFVLAIVMTVFLIKTRHYGRRKYGKMYMISLSMIISGAIGNLIDRVLLGYVVDFIQFDFIVFPVFNVADSLVCVGAVILGIYWLFLMQKAEKLENDRLAELSEDNAGAADDTAAVTEGDVDAIEHDDERADATAQAEDDTNDNLKKGDS